MHIADMHWQQVEEYLTRDDRAVVPLGCTEQHAYFNYH
jgi:creatinine amidohydrolase